MEWIDLENNHEDEECLRNLDENGICKMCGKNMIIKYTQIMCELEHLKKLNRVTTIQRNYLLFK